MLYPKTYTCRKCGKRFTKTVGGVIMTAAELEIYPVCDKCRVQKVCETVRNILKK